MTTDENAVSESEEKATADADIPAENLKADKKTSESKPSKKELKQNKALNEELVKLQDQLKKAEDKAAEHWEELLRSKADLENTRKRLQRDVENAHKYAVEKFIQDLLPVIDSLELGINAAREIDADIHKVKEGTELTLKMFNDCANKFGVEAIDPTEQPFNPELHQAMSIQESNDYEPDTVIAVMQKGYLLNGRLVRPAMVVVSKAAENPPASEQSQDSEEAKNIEAEGSNKDEKA